MTVLRSLALAASLALTSLPAAAEDGVHVIGAYVLTSGAAASVYLEVENRQDQDDVLLSARSDAAQKVTIHTSAENAAGVMSMAETTLPLPALGFLALQPGQNHIMLMGLTRQLTEGDLITLTLTFDRAGEVAVEVPVVKSAPPADHAGHSTSP